MASLSNGILSSMSLRIHFPQPKMCEECGEDPVPHSLVYLTLVIEELMSPYFKLMSGLAELVAKPAGYLGAWLEPLFMEACVGIGVAEYLGAADDKVSLLGRVLWDEAQARGISIREFRLFGLAKSTFIARLPNGKLLAYEAIPHEPGTNPVSWIDNKAVLKKKFLAAGLPIAAGAAAQSFAGAKRIFARVHPPVIVKPHSGSGSRHTVMHINNKEGLRAGFAIASQLSPLVMVEEELVGWVYRITVVDGVHMAALRRYQPNIVGDDVHTVAQLVEEENKDPRRKGPYFSPIKLDVRAQKELHWQGLTAESIPKQGQRVTLNQKVNWSVGGTTEDVTDIVHPENRKLFEKVARILHAPVVGIDFIIGDIERSWEEQERCGIIECNSAPFLDNHHLPYFGKPQNVAGMVWDMVS